MLAAVNRGEALVRAYPGHPNSKAIVALRQDRSPQPTAATRQLAAKSGLPAPPEEGLT